MYVYKCVFLYLYLYVYLCVCVCLCVWAFIIQSSNDSANEKAANAQAKHKTRCLHASSD